MAHVNRQHSKECSCKGANEDCFKCGGSGFINDDADEAPIGGSLVITKPPFVCSMCAMRFEDKTLLAAHALEMHTPLRRLQPQPESSPIDHDAKVSCLRCKSTQWVKQLDRHLGECFGGEQREEQRDEGFVLCSLCRNPVKRRNANKHLLKVHSILRVPSSESSGSNLCSSLPSMGFCAFCKVAVNPSIEQCPECMNRRFRFLTGRRQREGNPPGRVVHIDEQERIERRRQGVKDLLIELEDQLGRLPSDDEAEYHVRKHFERSKCGGWMQYIDTRTKLMWWEPFEEIEWRIRQLKDF